MEHRHACGGAIDPIEHEAVQMDVKIGGRADRFLRVTAPVAAWVRFSPACLIRNPEMTRWTICKTGVRSSGCAANRKRSGIGNESTHCRTGTDGVFYKFCGYLSGGGRGVKKVRGEGF